VPDALPAGIGDFPSRLNRRSWLSFARWSFAGIRVL